MPPYQIIDISQNLDDFVFPGNPNFQLTGPFNRITGENPEFVYDFLLCSQTGTHIQGPHYFLEAGSKIETFPLSSFEGEAFMIDLEKRGTDTTREDLILKLGQEKLDSKILVLRTGHMEELISEKKLDPIKRPGLSLEAAKYLAQEKKVKMIAIDSIGVESRVTKNYEVNKYLCEQGVLLLEGLVNLAAIKKKHFFLEAFPLKVQGVEGTPCRAIVKIDL